MAFEEILLVDRSDRGKLRLTGEQRAWFLHQVVTNRFEDIRPGETRAAAMLTPHGRMVGFFEAVATDDSLLLHLESDLADPFADALRRYVFATRVEIEDVTGEWGLLLLVGDRWRDAAARIEGAVLHETLFLGPPAGYLWLPHGRTSEAAAALQDAGARRGDEEEAEAIRIAHGRPRWGRDMDAKSLPQEARLDELDALDFHKGCYVGQEAVAKIFFRGKVNRKIRKLDLSGPAAPGAEARRDGEKVGVVTSASGNAAIAMLKHTVEPGATVDVDGMPAKVAG
jgi:tRNA-modifying protein YgfZ